MYSLRGSDYCNAALRCEVPMERREAEVVIMFLRNALPFIPSGRFLGTPRLYRIARGMVRGADQPAEGDRVFRFTAGHVGDGNLLCTGFRALGYGRLAAS